MVKLRMPLLRCALAVELWHFWGDGRDHDHINLKSHYDSLNDLKKIFIHINYKLYTFLTFKFTSDLLL